MPKYKCYLTYMVHEYLGEVNGSAEEAKAYAEQRCNEIRAERCLEARTKMETSVRLSREETP